MQINKTTVNLIKDLALNGNIVFDADFRKKTHVDAIDFFKTMGFNLIYQEEYCTPEGITIGAYVEIQTLR